MPASELQIIDYLRRDWDAGLRITTIDQAMRALGLPEDEQVRWHVGQALDDAWRQRLGFRQIWRGLRWLRGFRWRDLIDLVGPSPLRKEIKQWSPASFILTNDEKLVVRYILRIQHDTGHLPPSSAIREALHLDELKARTALRILQRLGFLTLNGDDQYHLASDYTALLQGLGFSFHTVTLQDRKQFNVP